MDRHPRTCELQISSIFQLPGHRIQIPARLMKNNEEMVSWQAISTALAHSAPTHRAKLNTISRIFMRASDHPLWNCPGILLGYVETLCFNSRTLANYVSCSGVNVIFEDNKNQYITRTRWVLRCQIGENRSDTCYQFSVLIVIFDAFSI